MNCYALFCGTELVRSSKISAAERISPVWAGPASVFQSMLLNLEGFGTGVDGTGVSGTGIGRDGIITVLSFGPIDYCLRRQDRNLRMCHFPVAMRTRWHVQGWSRYVDDNGVVSGQLEAFLAAAAPTAPTTAAATAMSVARVFSNFCVTFEVCFHF